MEQLTQEEIEIQRQKELKTLKNSYLMYEQTKKDTEKRMKQKLTPDGEKMYSESDIKKEANDIVFSYIRRRMNLIFNSDSLLITKSNDSYTITLINKKKKKYWNIYSNKKDINYNILCRKGNLEDVFEFLYKI